MYAEAQKIKSFDDLCHCIKTFDCAKNLILLETKEELILQSPSFINGCPKFVLKICNDLRYEAFHYGIKCIIETLSSNKMTSFKQWSQIEEAIRFLGSAEVCKKKRVIHEQITSMGRVSVGEKKYSPEMIVRAFEYFATSRSAYKRIREDFELPSISLLTQITSAVKQRTDDSYLKSLFSNLLDPKQKSCLLLLDEVYVKSTLQYHGGNVFGQAINKPHLLANTVLSFMIVTLHGGPRFLYKMLPVKELDAAFLCQQTTLIVETIKQCGGFVKAIICDGNRVNQSLFKKLQSDSIPWRTDDNIFLLYDYVHLLKNIRNNWITEKSQTLQYMLNGEEKVAKWQDVEELKRLQSSDHIVTMSHLSEIAVHPKPIERQKISFCLQVFSDETIAALQTHPQLANTNDTA